MGNDLIIGRISGALESLLFRAGERDKHLYVCGGTGTGKSKFLESLIRQDIKAWRKSQCGLLVLDPHGSLYDSLISWLAWNKIDRPIIPIDLRHDDWVVAYNLLRQRELADPAVLVDNITDAMAYVWGQGGTDQTPLFARWAGNIIRTLYENNRLNQDLVGDGWSVSIQYAVGARHIDYDPLGITNEAKIAQVSSLISTARQASGPNVVFLLGHLAIPYSGSYAQDGHQEHRGPWTADGYYGFVDKSGWVRALTNVDTQFYLQNTNDHRFINDEFPSPIEMPVGRVDFANLPTFAGATFLPQGTATNSELLEIELTRQYLNKDHKYRINTLQSRPGTCIRDDHPGLMNIISDQMISAVSGQLLGIQPCAMFNGVPYYQKVPCTWGVFWSDGHDNAQDTSKQLYSTNSNVFTTSNLTNSAEESRVLFYCIFGSYFPDWNRYNAPNNLLRGLLGTPNAGLAAIAASRWRLDRLALGAPLSSAMDGLILLRYQSIIGDPTLRLFRLSPPQGVVASSNGGTVALNWAPSVTKGTTYFVYRSSNGLSGFGAPLNNIPIVGTSYTTSAGAGLYQVRACLLTLSGSGSFYNLSQGTFVNVN